MRMQEGREKEEGESAQIAAEISFPPKPLPPLLSGPHLRCFGMSWSQIDGDEEGKDRYKSQELLGRHLQGLSYLPLPSQLYLR